MSEREQEKERAEDEPMEDLDVEDKDAEGIKGGMVDKASPIDKGEP